MRGDTRIAPRERRLGTVGSSRPVPRRDVIVIAGREFELTHHCIERYRERVCRHLSLGEARRELRGRLRGAEIHLTLPEDARGILLASRLADEWVWLPDVPLLFPVREGRILTCYARASVGASIRIIG